MKLTFAKATTSDIPILTETAFASKNTWGYPPEWVEMWRAELTMTEEKLQQQVVVKAFDEGRFVGYFNLLDLGENKWELDGLWVVPGNIGKGYGKLLFQQLVDFLRQQNAEVLEVVSDPNANGFYEKMGGKLVGKFPSKPEGRELDVFQYQL